MDENKQLKTTIADFDKRRAAKETPMERGLGGKEIITSA